MKKLVVTLIALLGLAFSKVSLADTTKANSSSSKSSKIDKSNKKNSKSSKSNKINKSNKKNTKSSKPSKLSKSDKAASKSSKSSKNIAKKEAKKTPIKKKKPLTRKININKADSKELQALSGIGEVKAKLILDYRKKHGSFKSLEELKNIKGIGDKTYDSLKSDISLR